MKTFLQLFPLYITIFADVIGWGVVLTIFAPMLLNTDFYLAKDVDHSLRVIILGFLVATYSIGQFFGSPLLGEFSDNIGRKKP